MSEEDSAVVAMGSEVPEVAQSPVQELEDTSTEGGELNLEIILNVPVEVSLQIGRASISIGELLQLSPGSVIELDRSVGDPHDVLVNGTLIAHGEVVVVDDQFGIRFTDIISPKERVKRLQ